ncbi:MAG: hypothetical protein HKN01_11035 [Acidimicrobiia bacterium]|nr:hypothetical protein [Acidimicrobiia bacterium]
MRQRPAIVKIAEKSETTETTVTITLDWNDEEHHGTASGPADDSHRPRIIGEATLRAVESVTEGALDLDLAAIATTPLGELQVAMAQIGVKATGELFVGTAMVAESDQETATVKAVLDALNRRITTLLTA